MTKIAKKEGKKSLLTRKCGAMEVFHREFENNPEFRSLQLRLSHSEFRSQLLERRSAGSLPYKIKVVVHCIQSPGMPRIQKSQVDSQIRVLNADFRLKNADRKKLPAVWKGLATDCMIEFELATKDPLGNSSTGMTHTEFNEADFSTRDRMKSDATGGKTPWPTDRYLNMWVCRLRDDVLGYAQFPGGSELTDGVVINYRAFGTKGTAEAPFNRGRTATHEVGHFLNLRHIWGDDPQCNGSDLVEDTPNQEGPNYGKPKFPKVSCGNGPNGDMFMNYMDYVDDDAMYFFTPQQVERMHATLAGPRAKLPWSK